MWTNLERPDLDPTIVLKFPLHMWFALHIFPLSSNLTNAPCIFSKVVLFVEIFNISPWPQWTQIYDKWPCQGLGHFFYRNGKCRSAPRPNSAGRAQMPPTSCRIGWVLFDIISNVRPSSTLTTVRIAKQYVALDCSSYMPIFISEKWISKLH